MKGKGHSFKLFQNRFLLDVAKYSFGDRVCDKWNKLPATIESSQGINAFKSKVRKIPEKHGGI